MPKGARFHDWILEFSPLEARKITTTCYNVPAKNRILCEQVGGSDVKINGKLNGNSAQVRPQEGDRTQFTVVVEPAETGGELLPLYPHLRLSGEDSRLGKLVEQTFVLFGPEFVLTAEEKQARQQGAKKTERPQQRAAVCQPYLFDSETGERPLATSIDPLPLPVFGREWDTEHPNAILEIPPGTWAGVRVRTYDLPLDGMMILEASGDPVIVNDHLKTGFATIRDNPLRDSRADIRYDVADFIIKPAHPERLARIRLAIYCADLGSGTDLIEKRMMLFGAPVQHQPSTAICTVAEHTNDALRAAFRRSVGIRGSVMMLTDEMSEPKPAPPPEAAANGGTMQKKITCKAEIRLDRVDAEKKKHYEIVAVFEGAEPGLKVEFRSGEEKQDTETVLEDGRVIARMSATTGQDETAAFTVCSPDFLFQEDTVSTDEADLAAKIARRNEVQPTIIIDDPSMRAHAKVFDGGAQTQPNIHNPFDERLGQSALSTAEGSPVSQPERPVHTDDPALATARAQIAEEGEGEDLTGFADAFDNGDSQTFRGLPPPAPAPAKEKPWSSQYHDVKVSKDFPLRENLPHETGEDTVPLPGRQNAGFAEPPNTAQSDVPAALARTPDATGEGEAAEEAVALPGRNSPDPRDFSDPPPTLQSGVPAIMALLPDATGEGAPLQATSAPPAQADEDAADASAARAQANAAEDEEQAKPKPGEDDVRLSDDALIAALPPPQLMLPATTGLPAVTDAVRRFIADVDDGPEAAPPVSPAAAAVMDELKDRSSEVTQPNIRIDQIPTRTVPVVAAGPGVRALPQPPPESPPAPPIAPQAPPPLLTVVGAPRTPPPPMPPVTGEQTAKVDQPEVRVVTPAGAVNLTEAEAERQRAQAAQEDTDMTARRTFRIPRNLRDQWRRQKWQRKALQASGVAALCLAFIFGGRYLYWESQRDDPSLALNDKKPIKLEDYAPPPEKPAEPPPPEKPTAVTMPTETLKVARLACDPYDPDGTGNVEHYQSEPYFGWYLLDCGVGKVVLGKPEGKPAQGNLWAKTDLMRSKTVTEPAPTRNTAPEQVTTGIACKPYDPAGMGREAVFTDEPYKGWYLLDCGVGKVVLGKPEGKPGQDNRWAKQNLMRSKTVIATR